MIKIDFHVHTYHSYDSLMKPEKIIEIARKRGLNGIVICDHNTVAGALETIKKNKYEDFIIIPASEIKTDIGDITGLFITKEITERKFEKVVHEIRKQNGKVLLNHPYHHHKLNRIDFSKIDFIEGYNSRLDKEKNSKALLLAKKFKIPVLAGSDAHLYGEIGNSYTIFSNFDKFDIKSYYYKKSNDFYITLSQYIKAYKTNNSSIFLSASKIFAKTTIKKIFTKKTD